MNICELHVNRGMKRTWHESVEVLMGKFFPALGLDAVEQALVIPKKLLPFTRDELQHVVRTLSIGKAPGMDGIKMLVVIGNSFNFHI